MRCRAAVVLMLACVSTATAKPDEPVSAARVARLVAALRHDMIRFNAERALHQLIEIGGPAVAALEQALDSPDWQQRQCAAEALRGIELWRGAPVPASAALGRVTVEGLRHDGLPVRQRGAERTCNIVFNAKTGTLYLMRHAREFEAQLRAALRSDDGQQQFLCAFVLGFTGRAEADAEAVAAVLLPHLRGNDLPCDGVMAAAALYRVGPGVKGQLLRARAEADAQQRELIDLILLDWTDPPVTAEKLKARKRMHHAGGFCDDPVYQMDAERMESVGMYWPDGMERVPLRGEGRVGR